LHPDAWQPIIIRDPHETPGQLAKVAGDKYSYADLDDFSDLIARTVQGAPETSKVERRGVLPQTIYLEYSQARLAAYGLQPQMSNVGLCRMHFGNPILKRLLAVARVWP
jgi:multidrug efflux pump subunit AcrB